MTSVFSRKYQHHIFFYFVHTVAVEKNWKIEKKAVEKNWKIETKLKISGFGYRISIFHEHLIGTKIQRAWTLETLTTIQYTHKGA